MGVPAISKHLKNIFETEELDEKVVVSILEIPTQQGKIEGKDSLIVLQSRSEQEIHLLNDIFVSIEREDLYG